MSSQTLATPLPGGLPPSPPPAPNLPSFSPPAWTGHLDAPRQPIQDTTLSPPEQTRERSSTSRPSHSSASEQQRQALNNLLAALAPIHAAKPSSPNQPSAPRLPSEQSQTNAPQVSRDVNNQSGSTHNNQVTDTSRQGPLESFPPLPLDHESFRDLPPQVSGLEPISPLVSDSSPTFPTPMATNQPAPSIHDRREIEAFAKIEFEDGNYYITTWACELGRDALAFRDALRRAEEAKKNPNGRSQSSSGRVSRPSDRIRRAGDSQVQGSVVSEAGGFGGVDDGPIVRSDEKPAGSGHPSHSSQVSASDVVKPHEVLHHPPLAPFDYHKNAEMQAQLDIDNEQPAPVTAEHLPSADTCPLIPIHAMANTTKSEIATHKSISRRHVRIEWDSDAECFKMKVLGRNGAFLDGAYVGRGVSKKLVSGSKLQISDIEMTFRLPRPKTEPMSDDSDRDEREGSDGIRRSTSPTSQEADEGPSRGAKKIRVNFNKVSATPHINDHIVGPDGTAMPPRKRGPGRPPKDGIMSTRERKEREKAARMAQLKAENGGKTPPPNAKNKLPKFPTTPIEELKVEKRKYNKRKRDGEERDVLPSIEGGEEIVGSDTERPVVKKARASKSPSPEYPPLATLTEEQLTRPSEPYARLIYDILDEIKPRALPLKQIYRALKMKYPFFVYRVESEGWQSSVRHNLNQEWNKLFYKGEKEGKGFAWKAIPGALQPQAERKRAAQAAAAAKPKPVPRNPPQNQGPAGPLNWQNSTPFPPQPYWQGPGQPPYPPASNGMPWPPGNMPPRPPGQGQPPLPNNPNIPPHQMPNPGTPQHGTPQPPPPHLQRPASHPAPPHSQPPPPQPQNQQRIPPPSSSTSAAPNMPCTLDGLMAIRRFETAMYDQVSQTPRQGGQNGQNASQTIEFWREIFDSVKKRLLHGAQQSSVRDSEGGFSESKEEVTIMGHVGRFVERFRNPAFVGFRNASGSRTASPVPGAVGGVGPSSMPQGSVQAPPANGSDTTMNGDVRGESAEQSIASTGSTTTAPPAPAVAPLQNNTPNGDNNDEGNRADDQMSHAPVPTNSDANGSSNGNVGDEGEGNAKAPDSDA